ncbi:MAG: hypothetical protein HEQ39_05725 [Rhizobacter sp.]
MPVICLFHRISQSVWLGLVALGFMLPQSQVEAGTVSDVTKAHLVRQLSLEAAEGSIRQLPLSESEVVGIVSKHLNSALRQSVKSAQGLQFFFPDHGHSGESHLSVVVLSYATSVIATNKAGLLQRQAGYFGRTKILTRFAYAVAGSHVIIVYTESAGNDRLVQLVDQLPSQFKSEDLDR